MYTLKIKITKEILEKTKNCKGKDLPDNCAISYAVRDLLPKAQTGITTIFPYGESNSSEETDIALPWLVTSFISRFDHCKPEDRAILPEMEFQIEIPDEVINKINIDEIKPLLQNHHCLQLINS